MEIFTKSNLKIKLPLLIIIIMGLLLNNFTRSNAQQGYWAAQRKIPHYLDNTEEPPYLVADQNHTVHAFNSQPLELAEEKSPRAIFYRQWTMENGWTKPNDILYDESSLDTLLVGAVSDKTGVVHLVLQKSIGDLYYTRAFLPEASSPEAWTYPLLIARSSLPMRPGISNIGAIAVDSTGKNLLVVYSGTEYGDGLYYVLSTDQGITWTPPYPVFLAGEQGLIVADPELILSESGSFHAVWTTLNDTGFGGPGYYSRFDSGINAWSDPMELDVPGIRTPSIVEHDSKLFVSYHHIVSNGNWWRNSNDSGQSWSYPNQVSPRHVGTNGGISFVVDSSNTLHGFFGERIDNNNHGMWHIVWTGSSWTNPEAVVKGRQIIDDTGDEGFDPRSARAAVSNGNVILVTWGTDGKAGLNGAWYSYKIFDTPELPTQSWEIPTAPVEQNILSENPSATSVVIENTPVLAEHLKNKQPGFLQNPHNSILIGAIPAVLLLVGIILLRIFYHYRNP